MDGPMLLAANQYVGWGRGKVDGVVGGKLPVRGMGRKEVNQVGRGGEGEKKDEAKSSRQHCFSPPLCMFSKVSTRGLSEKSEDGEKKETKCSRQHCCHDYIFYSPHCCHHVSESSVRGFCVIRAKSGFGHKNAEADINSPNFCSTKFSD